MSEPNLTPDERQRLAKILANRAEFSDEGARGRRTLLRQAGLERFVTGIALSGPARTVAGDVIGRLEDYGPLPDRPGSHALGALLESLLKLPDLAPRDATFIRGLAAQGALEAVSRHAEAHDRAAYIPCMAEAPPEDYVPRPKEFEELIAHLLDPKRRTPVALAAALRGAGGYGKTTLARAICYDERVRAAFNGGILWVTLGQEPDLMGQLLKLYDALAGERPAFVDLEDAANKLSQQLHGRECLIVIDDVWNHAHLRPFRRGGERCARLITTRNRNTLPSGARAVDVDAMQTSEALSLLGAGLPSGQAGALRTLAARLGEWPLLLRLANGALANKIALHLSLDEAVAELNEELDEFGLTAFDATDAQERDQAVSATLNVSLRGLGADRARYDELALFPEDAYIPLAALEKLWSAAGRMRPVAVRRLCERLYKLSLLLEYDARHKVVRLHDVVRAYLVHEQRDRLPALHRRFLDAYGLGRWSDLPPDEPYLWHALAYHLHEASRGEKLRDLLLDYGWLQAKLDAVDVAALLADYDTALRSGEGGEALLLVQGAIMLSAHVLARDKAQLAGQLLGRLLSSQESSVGDLLEGAREWSALPWLRPLTAGLRPSGGALLRTLEGHSAQVWAAALTPDGTRAVSASDDRTLKVWDLRTGEALRTLEGHSASVKAVAVTPDGMRAVSASDDRTLKVWDLRTGEALRSLEGHSASVWSVALSPDGTRAVSASRDRTLKVWDLRTGEVLRMLEGHSGGVRAVAVTPDGTRTVSASNDRTLKVWDLRTGKALRTLEGHNAQVRAVAVTPDGTRAVSASDDRTLKVWDLRTGEALRTLEGHSAQVRAVAVTPDGTRAVSASSDRTLKVWDLHTGEALHTLEGHSAWVRAVAVTPDSTRAISGSRDRTLKVWDLAVGEARQKIGGHSGSVGAVTLTRDDAYALSASSDRTLKVWDLRTGEALRTLEGHHDSVWSVALTAEGARAVSASRDCTLKVWDLRTGKALRTLIGHSHWVGGVALTPDGARAVSASRDRTLKVWDLHTGEALRTLIGHSGGVRAVAVTPDGTRTVSASTDRTLKVWNLLTGEALRTLEGHSASVKAVAVTPDGTRAVSASDDRTLKVWDLRTAEVLRTLEGHSASVLSVALSPDGTRAVSASDDQTLKVWDLRTAEVMATYHADGALYACAIASDGRTIIAGGASGVMHVLRLEGATSPPVPPVPHP